MRKTKRPLPGRFQLPCHQQEPQPDAGSIGFAITRFLIEPCVRRGTIAFRRAALCCLESERKTDSTGEQVKSPLFESCQRKGIRYCQDTQFVVFQRDFLRKHDVTGGEADTWGKAQACSQPAATIQLVYVSLRTGAYPVSFPGMAADNLKVIVRIVLFQLIGREPFSQ
jgi:hypothetical protein